MPPPHASRRQVLALPALPALLTLALSACGPDEPLDERAVAASRGRVLDLSLLERPGGGQALGWRESTSPNGTDARAAFLLLGSSGTAEGPVRRDANTSTASSPLVATEDTLLRVLAQRRDPDDWGLVVVVRDTTTGELLPDGYRTLPIFAGATLTDLRLVPAGGGALLAWVERAGGELPADLVTLVALDAGGAPLGSPLALTDLPSEIVAIDVASFDDRRRAVFVALARRAGSAQVLRFTLQIDETLRLDGAPQQLAANVSADDRVLDLETDGTCVELLLTQGGAPVRARIEPDPTTFTPLHLPDDPGIAPRLIPGGPGGVLYLYDRPDGETRAQVIDHGADCEVSVGRDRAFPLSRVRCTELSTTGGDPLPYACSTACLTRNCDDEWVYVGRATF